MVTKSAGVAASAWKAMLPLACSGQATQKVSRPEAPTEAVPETQTKLANASTQVYRHASTGCMIMLKHIQLSTRCSRVWQTA